MYTVYACAYITDITHVVRSIHVNTYVNTLNLESRTYANQY